MSRSHCAFRLAAGLVIALGLGGCTVHYIGEGVHQESQLRFWPAPKNGRWLCLTSTPGTPIHVQPDDRSAVSGYTTNVVAFAGEQTGHWISVIHYDSARIGFIDGLTIKPFQPAFPGQRCIVWEDVYHRRPLFEID